MSHRVWRRPTGVALVLVVVSGLTACTGNAPLSSTPSTTSQSATGSPTPYAGHGSMPGMSNPVAFSHIHAAGRDLKDGTLLLATHEGLFAQDRSGRTMRRPVMDLMGFDYPPTAPTTPPGTPVPAPTCPSPSD